MILVWILLVPVAGGLAAVLSERLHKGLAKWISLFALVIDSCLVLYLWFSSGAPPSGDSTAWAAEYQAPWIPRLGITFHLAVDGVGLILLALTAFLGSMAVLASWSEIAERSDFFFLCLTWTLAGVFGVFMALDLFLFYFAWEMMLVPMYFLIAVWGHEDRFRAGVKFFVFTQFSGLLMLVSILGLYFVHAAVTGVYTFDYQALLGTQMEPVIAMLLTLGFLAAFLVKLPAVPFHTWLPDAHTQAPTAGSVILAGLLLKTGAYGLFRFSIPLFPGASAELAPVLAILGIVGILYGGLLAFAQTDLKRLVAYTSVSHMGFVLLGLSAGNELAFQGAVIQMVSHGLSTGALFVLAGVLQERLRTRDLSRMGGLWASVPRLGGFSMFFALASLGLPGLGNFVGEFLVVLGAYRVSGPMAAAAALGFIVSTIYSLRMVQLVFLGERREGPAIADLSAREMAVMVAMAIPLLWLGLAPQALIDKARSRFPVAPDKVVTESRGEGMPSVPTLEKGGK